MSFILIIVYDSFAGHLPFTDIHLYWFFFLIPIMTLYVIRGDIPLESTIPSRAIIQSVLVYVQENLELIPLDCFTLMYI